MDTIIKNLWLMITVVIPGLFTYGTWRLLLVLHPSNLIDTVTLGKIDESALVTTSIIISIALLQQIVGISIEFLLSVIAGFKKHSWKNFHLFFRNRFKYASEGLLNEHSQRVISNSFLSINIFVGLAMLLIYFTKFECLGISQWIPVTIMVFLSVNILCIIYRLNNAVSTIAEIKHKNDKGHKARHTKKHKKG